jgi:tRNA G18 (ribose-2'-O)-methylase SpoU
VRPITDPDDPDLADYRGLTDAAARRRLDRDGNGAFIVEGAVALEQLLASGRPIRSVLVTPNRVGLLQRLRPPPGVPVLVVERPLLADVAGYDVHRGVLACGSRTPPPPLEELLDAHRDVVLVEAVTDAENVGALFRNVAAFGLGCVVLDRRCADPLYRRSIRVSSGWTLRVPHATVERLGPTIDAPTGGRTVVALSPSADADPLDEVLDAGALDGPVALVVGTEGAGLEQATLARAGRVVRVPMAPQVDSLNVATTVAVVGALLDARRRRLRRP